MNRQLRSKSTTVAVVYDRANTNFGGAEYVLSLIRDAFPQAPLYTSVHSPHANWTHSWTIRTSFLQHCRLARTRHQLFVALMPLAFETLDLSTFDVIVSVTSAEAKGVLTLPHQRHICYLFTPTRYLYETEEYSAELRWLNQPGFKQLFSLVRNYLTRWDQQAAWRPDQILTLSSHAADKIEKTYGRSAQVVYPAVKSAPTEVLLDLEAELNKHEYVLSISRLVSYKKVDLVVASCLAVRQLCLVVGDGAERNRLIRQAGSKAYVRSAHQDCVSAIKAAMQSTALIVFLNSVTEAERFALLKHARTVCMLGNEDFGLVALEALIAKTPVVLSQYSGAAEVVSHISAAQRLTTTNVQTVSAALGRAQHLTVSDRESKQLADQFSSQTFIQQLQAIVYDSLT